MVFRSDGWETFSLPTPNEIRKMAESKKERVSDFSYCGYFHIEVYQVIIYNKGTIITYRFAMISFAFLSSRQSSVPSTFIFIIVSFSCDFEMVLNPLKGLPRPPSSTDRGMLLNWDTRYFSFKFECFDPGSKFPKQELFFVQWAGESLRSSLWNKKLCWQLLCFPPCLLLTAPSFSSLPL